MTKLCRKCGSLRDLSEFGKRTGTDKPRAWCRPCERVENLGRYRRRAETRAAHRKSYLKTVYQLTLEQYDAMLNKQGSVCAICHEPCRSGMRLAVDHCHNSGKLRGLLCRSCNVGLGHFDDKLEMLDRAREYLRGYEEDN